MQETYVLAADNLLSFLVAVPGTASVITKIQCNGKWSDRCKYDI